MIRCGARSRDYAPVTCVLPPRPALPLLPEPKVSEPRRKSRRERASVRQRVFRARHACVSLFFLSLSFFVRVFPSARVSFSPLASREGLRLGSSPTLRSIAPDAKVEAVQYRASVPFTHHAAVHQWQTHSCGLFRRAFVFYPDCRQVCYGFSVMENRYRWESKAISIRFSPMWYIVYVYSDRVALIATERR